MQENRDVLRISYAPLRRLLSNTGRSMGIGAGVGVVLLIQLFQIGLIALYAALMWWISDLAYSVTWLFGFPIRLFAIVTSVMAFFAILGGIVQMASTVLAGLWMMISGIFASEPAFQSATASDGQSSSATVFLSFIAIVGITAGIAYGAYLFAA